MKSKIDISDFRVPAGNSVRLKSWPTRVEPFYASKADYDNRLHEQIDIMRAQQELLYAHDRYALLVIFQAMDAAGKDGAIKHVMSGVNPQGCQVYSFKHPSAEELDHDFLWRATRSLPERGRIGIFNRSYYEEVLIVHVHPEILASQKLTKETTSDRNFWKHRYESINDLENHLHRNGTRVVKFFLHLSKQEQARRFIARIDDPGKNWKFSRTDVDESLLWDKYMTAYEKCLSSTSTRYAPWYVVPADDKLNARLIISRIVVETMRGLRMTYPRVDKAKMRELRAMRARLEKTAMD